MAEADNAERLGPLVARLHAVATDGAPQGIPPADAPRLSTVGRSNTPIKKLGESEICLHT